MNANEITFGIEIETTIPAGTMEVGNRHGNTQAMGLPFGWAATSDGSIRTRAGRIGCEFVSPVLRGEEGIRQVVEVCRTLNAMGAQVNSSCGFHVHCGFDRNNRPALARLITFVANFEKAIFASTGTKNRERGRWSAGIAAFGSVEAAERAGRYRVLNLTNLQQGTKPTVEFRAFAGTLNADKMIAHIQQCIAMVQLSHEAKRTTNWTAKAPVATSPIHRSGEGQTALTRLFYRLGWTKGRTAKTLGAVGESVQSIRKSKKTLMKMARKYDAQP